MFKFIINVIKHPINLPTAETISNTKDTTLPTIGSKNFTTFPIFLSTVNTRTKMFLNIIRVVSLAINLLVKFAIPSVIDTRDVLISLACGNTSLKAVDIAATILMTATLRLLKASIKLCIGSPKPSSPSKAVLKFFSFFVTLSESISVNL